MQAFAHVLMALVLAVSALAQSAAPVVGGVSRKALLAAALAQEKSVARVEATEITLAPRQRSPLHTHPCPVVGIVLEGRIVYQLEGGPARVLQAGEAFHEPAHARVARFDNDGDTPAKFAAFYLVGAGDRELVQLLPR